MASTTSSDISIKSKEIDLKSNPGNISSTLSTPLSTPPTSPNWPDAYYPSPIFHHNLPLRPSHSQAARAIRDINNLEGILLTLSKFEVLLSIINECYGIETTAITILGNGARPDNASDVPRTQDTQVSGEFSEKNCKRQLEWLNQRTQTDLSLEVLLLIVELVNERYGAKIRVSHLLNWLQEEAEENVEAALAFLGVDEMRDVTVDDVQMALGLLDLEVGDGQLTRILL